MNNLVKENKNLSQEKVEQVDTLLQGLVAIPEKTAIELGITLNVNGLIVSGRLIGEKAYFEELINIFENVDANQDVKDTLQDFIKELSFKSNQEKNNGDEIILPKFIHLKNAQMYPSQGQGMPTTRGALWRCRISEVNGFSLGEIL